MIRPCLSVRGPRALSRSTLAIALMGSILCVISSGGQVAHAQPAKQAAASDIPGEVLIILGGSEGTVDPALAKLEALQKPPFDGFAKKTLLKRVTVSVAPGKDTEVELPNGRKLRLSLLEKTAEGRFRVSVSINRPGKQDYLPVMTVVAAPGDPFFVAGQKHEGGTLIIGIRVGKAG
jgi:hypothetical protein